MATPGLDTVACCSPPCESTRVARTDAPCAQKGVRSRVHAAFALALALTLTISRYSCYTRSREEGERKGKGGERRGCYMCVRTYAQSNGREASVSCSRLVPLRAFLAKIYLIDRSSSMKKKKKNRIHLSTFSFARAKLPAK